MFHFANAVIILSKSNRISLCASEKISAFSLSSAIVDLRSHLFQQSRKYLVLVLKLDNFNHYWKGVLYISINCLMGVDGLLLESVQILFNTLVCDWNYLLHPTHYQRKLIYFLYVWTKRSMLLGTKAQTADLLTWSNLHFRCAINWSKCGIRIKPWDYYSEGLL